MVTDYLWTFLLNSSKSIDIMRIYPSHALVNKDNRIKEPKRIENEIEKEKKHVRCV